MDKVTFDEKHLEQLLQSMPKVKDHRSPEQLFATISSRIEENEAEKRLIETISTKRKRSWLVPTFASVAAILIIALVIPSFMLQQDSTMENSQTLLTDEATIEEKQSSPTENEVGIMGADVKLARIAPGTEPRVITAITAEEEVVTVAVPDQNAQFVIPLSFVVPKGDALAKVNTIQEHLQEEEWGLSEYILAGVLVSEGSTTNGIKKVILDVSANHPYGNGSAMEVIFIATVKETFKHLGYDVVEFKTEGKPGIVLGNYGNLQELYLENKDTKNIYYLYQPLEQAQPLLVPFPREKDFTKALNAMKSTTELGFQEINPSIPEEIKFDNIIEDNQDHKVIVEFGDGTQLQNEAKFRIMIEAILMTAKEYGFEFVEFQNAPIDLIGPYQLNGPITVPLGVNPMPY